jgi:hypothetical protein
MRRIDGGRFKRARLRCVTTAVQETAVRHHASRTRRGHGAIGRLGECATASGLSGCAGPVATAQRVALVAALPPYRSSTCHHSSPGAHPEAFRSRREQQPWSPRGRGLRSNAWLRCGALLPSSSRLTTRSSCRRNARYPPPRRRRYGGQRHPGDSAAHRAYRASGDSCRY